MAFAGTATKHKGLRRFMRLLAMITAMAMVLSMNPIIGLSINGETPTINSLDPSTGVPASSGNPGTRVKISGNDFGVIIGQVTFAPGIDVIPTRYEETADGMWEYKDKDGNDISWTTRSLNFMSGGSQKETNIGGSYAAFSVAGDRVAWIATKGPSYGIAKVYIDGNLKRTVDLYNATEIYRQEVFSESGLGNTGNKQLRIEVTGTKSGSANNTKVNIDAIDVGGFMTRENVTWTDSSIDINVPPGATTGRITVKTAADATCTSPGDFQVIKTPAITGLSPEYGVVGSSVTIVGTGFGISAAAVGGKVTFGGVDVTPTAPADWSDKSIEFKVPTDTTAGTKDVVVSNQAGSSNTRQYEVYEKPDIQGINPDIGSVGKITKITVKGVNFGTRREYVSKVIIGTIECEIISWVPESITANVPGTLDPGDFQVLVQNPAGEDSWASFKVVPKPEVYNIDPIRAKWGDQVHIDGNNFGKEDEGIVSINDQRLRQIIDQQSASIEYVGTWGTYNNSNCIGGSQGYSKKVGSSATFTFEGTSVTWIIAKHSNYGISKVYLDGVYDTNVDLYSPSYEWQSRVYTRSGLSVGTHTLRIEVAGTKNPSSSDYYTGIDAFSVSGNIVAWSNTAIDFLVPSLFSSGPLYVETPAGISLNQPNLLITNPLITSVTPNPAAANSTITVAGSNFGASKATVGGKLFFAGNEITPTSWSDTSITFTAPNQATTGDVQVTTNGTDIDHNGPSNKKSLTVSAPLPPPVIESVSGENGEMKGGPGQPVTITGHDFGTKIGKVNFNGVDAIPTRYEDNGGHTGYQFGGTWIQADDSHHSSGTINRTSIAGAQVTFSFDGTRASWIAAKGKEFGIAKVYVDGESKGTVDLFEDISGLKYQDPVFEVKGLASGPHTVRVEVTGTKNSKATGTAINIDAFDVGGGSLTKEVVWTDNAIAVYVPDLATTGHVQVTTDGGSDIYEVNGQVAIFNVVAPPSANAGSDQTVDEGKQVTLDGTGSSGSDLKYSWTKISGPAVTLANSDTVKPSLTSPTVTADTTLVFELTVTDKFGRKAADRVDITVKNVTSSSGGSSSGGSSSSGSTSTTASTTTSTTNKGTIHGFVLTTAHAPIQGTVVRAHNNGGGDYVVPANAGGEFRVSVPTGIYTMYYDAPGYVGQIQEAIVVNVGKETNVPNVLLSGSGGVSIAGTGLGEIGGFVLNTAHQPIPGTCIRINNILMPTNPGGEFRFTLVHPGTYNIYYDAPGYAGQVQEYIVVRAGQRTTTPTVLLSASVPGSNQIRGFVWDNAHHAIPGTAVRINATVIPTSGSGEFRFSNVYPGTYKIYYDAPGFVGQTQEGVRVQNGVITVVPTVILNH